MIPHVQLPGPAGEWTSKDRQSVAERIGGICRKEGYFFVHNHGVPAELLKEVYAEMQRFYRLPPEAVRRFYAMTLTHGDRARILCGRPPRGFSLTRALSRPTSSGAPSNPPVPGGVAS